MALLFMDSFDHLATADLSEKWTTISTGASGTVEIASSVGRRSSQALRLRNNFSSSPKFTVQKVLTPGDATAIVGMAVNVPSGAVGVNGLVLAYVKDGADAQVTLRLNADYTLSVLRGSQTGTVLGTTVGAMTAGSFVYLEWKVLIHNTTGTVDLRVNSASVVSLTSQNTRATATAQWTSLVVGMEFASSAMLSDKAIDIDDLYVLDGTGAAPWNTFLGDCRVDVRKPTGAGATTGWTPNTGTNWAAVDDAAPDDDTTYTSAAAAALTDTFVVEDAPVAGATIYGVQHCLSVKKTDAGAASIAPVVRHSGADYVGTAMNPGTTYAVLQQIQMVNPGTAAAWTEAGFNAAEFGYRRIT